MRFHGVLDVVFATQSHVRVLRALFAMPGGWEGSAREIARRSGTAHPTALRTLATLVDLGLVRLTRTPSADRYRLNRDHEAFAVLGSLFEWERAAIDRVMTFLSQRIRAGAPDVTGAFLFGSAARGEERVDSDLDLAVTCARGRARSVERALQPLTDEAWDRFGVWIQLIVGEGTLRTLTQAGRTGSHLWRTIERHGLRVLGEPSDAA